MDKHHIQGWTCPQVECYIFSVRERVRYIYNALPFQKLPARITVEMAYSTVFWLDSFPNPNRISKSISPTRIITGQDVNYKRHCTLGFWSYAQDHEQYNNHMESRTTGAIAQQPMENTQGGHYSFSLTTGRRLNSSHWTQVTNASRRNCKITWNGQFEHCNKIRPYILWQECTRRGWKPKEHAWWH